MTVLNPRLPRRAAFTLIELLTVMAIIGVLAAIGVGMAGAAKTGRVNSRAQADLRKVQTAIEAYKADRNAYPPDHLLPAGSDAKVDPALNPLFYELRGMSVDNGNFVPRGGGDAIAPATVKDVFGRRGFLNSSADASEPARSYYDPKASEIQRVTVGTHAIDLLVTAFPWPRNPPDGASAPVAGTLANPWRYVSTSPTNNSGSFDLWAEVYVGKERKVFKNW